MKIIYIGHTNCKLGDKEIHPGQKVEVTQNQYNDLVQDRHWQDPKDYDTVIKLREKRSIKKPSKKKEVKT